MRAMLDADPGMMGRNLPTVISETYGEYSRSHQVE